MPPSTTSLRIAIVGAGAIGTTVAVLLASAGHQVSVLARGETLLAMRRSGAQLIDQQGQHSAKVAVSDSPAELGEQDIVLLCTKSQAVSGLLPHLTPLFNAHTCLVPMVNGTPWWLFMGLPDTPSTPQHIEAVDPGGQLVNCVPAGSIIGCVVYISAQVTSPGQAYSTTPHRLILGEITPLTTERKRYVMALIEALDSVGISTRHTPHIRDAVWSKIAANLTSNPLSVITKTTLETLYGDPWLRNVVEQLFEEVRFTASACGSQLEMTLPELLEVGEGMKGVQTSMLQDYQQERELELGAIVGGVIELAKRQNIAVPTINTVFSLAHYLENAGYRESCKETL
ncbi:ketopantoate reductase family protein [Halomonas halocynthiae]|uniref:ketopantoate reductase family protein n=1 Tax=Halomonas halocynthiae TaxID=176290 RepID=UPI0003FF05EB|nr:2-dehydropantoate 2-reductase [Halomonas halocynthiae]